MRSLPLCALALLGLPLAVHAATPNPEARKLTALVLAMDDVSASQQLEIEGFLNDALAEYRGIEHKRPETFFPAAAADDARNSYDRAFTGYKESRAAFDKKDYETAERLLRATRKELKKSTPAMPDSKILCEVTAMYGATLLARGDVEEARFALLDLIAVSPDWELSPKRYSKEYLRLRGSVARSHPAQLRGSVTIASLPSGGRVLVDGEVKGFAPLTVQALPMGRHFVQVERPGHQTWGQLVDVSPEPTDLLAELKPTPAYEPWQALEAKLKREVELDRSNGAAKGLGPKFDVDRVFLGTLRHTVETGRSELSVALFDTRDGRRVAFRRMSFRGNEYGELRKEVGRVIHNLLADASGSREKVRKSGDPLEGVQGTEEWNSERQRRDAAKEKERQRYQGSDPLDSRSGMEDW
jgi:hypothetical protein